MHQNGLTKWLESIHELITSIQPELRFSSVCYALDNTFYSKSIKHAIILRLTIGCSNSSVKWRYVSMYGIFSNVVYILCLLKVRGISGNVKGRNKTDVDVQSNLCREYIVCFRYVQVCYRPVNFFWFWKRKNISLLGILCPVLVIHNCQQAAFSTSNS